MLPKAHRFTRGDFAYTARASKKFPGTYVMVIPAKVPFDKVKAGIIVSRRSFGNAVQRSYARRVLYHAFRDAGGLELKGYYFLLIPRPQLLHASYEVVVQDLARVLASVADFC